MPLIAGRFFNVNDNLDSPNVVLINHAMAELYWPGESAVGKRFTFRSQPKEKDWYTIVGVVGDVKDFPNSAAAEPAFYWSTSQQTPRQVILAVRTNGQPMNLLEAFTQDDLIAALGVETVAKGLGYVSRVSALSADSPNTSLSLTSGRIASSFSCGDISVSCSIRWTSVEMSGT